MDEPPQQSCAYWSNTSSEYYNYNPSAMFSEQTRNVYNPFNLSINYNTKTDYALGNSCYFQKSDYSENLQIKTEELPDCDRIRNHNNFVNNSEQKCNNINYYRGDIYRDFMYKHVSSSTNISESIVNTFIPTTNCPELKPSSIENSNLSSNSTSAKNDSPALRALLTRPLKSQKPQNLLNEQDVDYVLQNPLNQTLEFKNSDLKTDVINNNNLNTFEQVNNTLFPWMKTSGKFIV